MSPRPRTIDDGAILAACHRVMQRVGPAAFTLALVADEAGLAAPTLLQRFGSKRKLLRAMSDASAGFGSAIVAELRTRHASPLSVVREFLLGFAQMARTPRLMVNHLAYLQMDLTDPVMHRNFLAMSREHQALVAGLLGEATVAGELTPHDNDALARVLGAVVTGGLLAWATYREGTARAWLERDLDLVIAPYRKRRRTPNA